MLFMITYYAALYINSLVARCVTTKGSGPRRVRAHRHAFREGQQLGHVDRPPHPICQLSGEEMASLRVVATLRQGRELGDRRPRANVGHRASVLVAEGRQPLERRAATFLARVDASLHVLSSPIECTAQPLALPGRVHPQLLVRPVRPPRTRHSVTP